MATIDIAGVGIVEMVSAEDDVKMQAEVAKASVHKRQLMAEYAEAEGPLDAEGLAVEAAVRGLKVEDLTEDQIAWFNRLDAYMMTADV